MADNVVPRPGTNSPPELDEYHQRKRATIAIIDSKMKSLDDVIAGATLAAAHHFLVIRFVRSTPSISEMVREELDDEVKGKHSIWQQYAISLMQHLPEVQQKALVPLRNQMAATWEYLYRLISIGDRWTPSWDMTAEEVHDKIQSLRTNTIGVTGILAAESLLDQEKTQARINQRKSDEQLKALGRLHQRRQLLGQPDYSEEDLKRDEDAEREKNEQGRRRLYVKRAIDALKRKSRFVSGDDLSGGGLPDPSVLIFEGGRMIVLPEDVATDVLMYLGGKYNG